MQKWRDALVARDILPTSAIFQQFRLTFVDNPVRSVLHGRQEHPTVHSMCGFSFLRLPGGCIHSWTIINSYRNCVATNYLSHESRLYDYTKKTIFYSATLVITGLSLVFENLHTRLLHLGRLEISFANNSFVRRTRHFHYKPILRKFIL